MAKKSETAMERAAVEAALESAREMSRADIEAYLYSLDIMPREDSWVHERCTEAIGRWSGYAETFDRIGEPDKAAKCREFVLMYVSHLLKA